MISAGVQVGDKGLRQEALLVGCSCGVGGRLDLAASRKERSWDSGTAAAGSATRRCSEGAHRVHKAQESTSARAECCSLAGGGDRRCVGVEQPLVPVNACMATLCKHAEQWHVKAWKQRMG